MKELPTRFLLVDTDLQVALSFEKALVACNKPATFKLCQSREMLIAALEKEQLPDYIVMDIKMPGLGGMAVIQQIKQQAKYRHIPLIIHSNTDNPAMLKEAKNAGAALWITKTNDYKDLRRALQFVFDNVPTRHNPAVNNGDAAKAPKVIEPL